LQHSLTFNSPTCAGSAKSAAAHSLIFALADGKLEDDPDWIPIEFPEWFVAQMQRAAEAVERKDP
jgi:hypothetical protein